MKCPVCHEPDLLMSERQGVEIDYCPSCRGIWLDRGELDKIVERLAAESSGGRAEQAPPRDDRGHDKDRSHDKDRGSDDKRKKKPSSFIMDVFEGFGS